MNIRNNHKTLLYDDSELMKTIDNKLVNLDISVLEQARHNCIKNGENTKILDKAIAEKKRRNKQEKQRKEEIKTAQRAGLLSGLFGENNSDNYTNNDLMPWEDELVKKGEYKSYNFEEEDTEEDDYYYDDLD